MPDFDKNKHLAYWIESAEADYATMLDMFKTKHYSWSLFMGHLVIEKLLKAYYVQEKNEFPPLIHDLRRVGEKAGLVFDEGKKVMVDTITRFNIRARYDDYKSNFYKLCTAQFTEEWLSKIQEVRQWIKTTLLK